MSRTPMKSQSLPVEGELSGPELIDAFVASYSSARNNLGRWFLDAPIHEAGRTWLVSKMWGRTTVTVLQQLVDLAPAGGFGFEPGSTE